MQTNNLTAFPKGKGNLPLILAFSQTFWQNMACEIAPSSKIRTLPFQNERQQDTVEHQLFHCSIISLLTIQVCYVNPTSEVNQAQKTQHTQGQSQDAIIKNRELKR